MLWHHVYHIRFVQLLFHRTNPDRSAPIQSCRKASHWSHSRLSATRRMSLVRAFDSWSISHHQLTDDKQVNTNDTINKQDVCGCQTDQQHKSLWCVSLRLQIKRSSRILAGLPGTQISGSLPVRTFWLLSAQIRWHFQPSPWHECSGRQRAKRESARHPCRSHAGVFTTCVTAYVKSVFALARR